MTTYQTIIHRAVLTNHGWDTCDITLFESSISQDPGQAMLEFDFHEPSHNNWFVSMLERIDGIIVDEEIFDSSVIELDEK